MAHRVSHRKFGRTTNQRKALLKGLASSLILHERITTTEAKAKAIRPVVEKLVTRAKENTEHNRRILMAKVGGENVVAKLLDLVGPTFKSRPGGYTRIIKIASRSGDNAKMAMIEFVENVSEKAAKEKIERKKPEEKTETKKVEVKEKKPRTKVKKETMKKKETKKE